MKLTIAIILAFLFCSAYAVTSISYTNADDQTFLMEFKPPTNAANEVRLEVTVTSQYVFSRFFQVGAICTVTGADGVFPSDSTSEVFVVVVICSDNNGCIPGTLPALGINNGTVDGKKSLIVTKTLF